MSRIQDLYSKYSKLDKSEFDVRKTQLFREDLKSIKDNELIGVEEHKLFLELLRLFRSIAPQFMQFIGTNFQATIKDLITVGSSGMYSNELHFMDELIQNVDDCEYEDPANAKLSVKCDWNNGIMVFEYNEKGFSPFNVYAITGIAEQAKNIDPNKVQIGEKGLGFKSVFGVANTVLIQSGYFSFKLDEEDFTCPIPEYDSFEYVHGTRLTLYMPDDYSKGNIRDWTDTRVGKLFSAFAKRYKSRDALLCKNPLLFLNKLSELRVFFDGWRSLKFTVERKIDVSAVNGFHKAEHVRLTYEEGHDFKDALTCTHYVMPIIYDRECCVSRYGKDTAFQTKKMNLQVIVPDLEFLKGKTGINKGSFYSFLPTQVKIPAPIVCHIPFKLDPSREDVDSQHENKWFTHSCDTFSEMFEDVLKDLAKTYKEDIVYYLPKSHEYLFQSDKQYSIFTLAKLKGEHFLSLPLFFTETKGYLSADEVYSFSEPEKVESVKRLAELIAEKKQLFITPDISKTKGLKIEILSNIPDKLFHIALSSSEKAEEIFKILESYDGFSFEEKVKSFQTLQLNGKQVASIFKSNKCISAFKKIAVNNIRNSGRPKFSFETSGGNVLDVKHIDETLHIEVTDFGELSRRYLLWIRNAVILAEFVPQGKYFIAQNVLLLSKYDSLSSLSSFCRELDPKDVFAATLELRNCSRELDLVADSISPDEYMRKLRNVRKAIQTAFGKDVYNNYIKIINQAGCNPERYINELLQNADDCQYASGMDPTFHLAISRDFKTITTQYNETGFTKANVRAITAIGESTKRRLISGDKDRDSIIGEKGVGFKSVFSVADKVSIYSGDFHFELSAIEPTIPKVIEKRNGYERGTTMIFELKEKMGLGFFNEEKVLRLCLCLRKLKDITIGDFKVKITEQDGIRSITINDKVYEYKIISKVFVVDDEQALAERRSDKRSINNEQNIKFYIPIGNKSGAKSLYLYSGLPTEIETKIPLIIDAPFELDTARANVLDNKWNTYICKKLYEALKELIINLKNTDGLNALRFVNVKRENNAYFIDLFSNAKLNQTSFLNELQAISIIPVWGEQAFACASRQSLFRIPKLLYYILENQGDWDENLNYFVKGKESKFDTILEALGVKVLPVEKVVPLLRHCYENFMEDEAFLKQMYSYFEDNLNSIKTIFLMREQLKNMRIIPVKGKTKNTTDFLCMNDFNGNLYVKDDAEISTDMCWILNTALLKKDLCEKLFAININVLTSVVEEEAYRNQFKKMIESETNVNKLYQFLLNEYKNNYNLFCKCRDYLIAYKFLIPLKNECNEIRKGGIYISKEDSGYFEGYLIPSHIAHSECSELAKFIRCEDIAYVHFDDLNISKQLTADDIESLLDDGIVNGFEILNHCKMNGWVPTELITQYQLDVFSPICVDYDEDIFNQPIKDKARFYEKMRERLKNLIRIEPREVKRTIRVGVMNNGQEVSIENSNRHDYVIHKYTTQPGYCVCQMCKTAKKLSYVEVNNIERLPKYYWEECGVVLCLECSKRFEELREKVDVRERFYREIKKANVDVDEPIEIPIAADHITFSQSHLAEIQEILKKQEEIE